MFPVHLASLANMESRGSRGTRESVEGRDRSEQTCYGNQRWDSSITITKADCNLYNNARYSSQLHLRYFCYTISQKRANDSYYCWEGHI